MIITRAAINATYEMENCVGTMIYSVLINHIGDDMDNYDTDRHIKTNCAKQTKGTYMDMSWLLDVVRNHAAKYQ